MSSRASPRLAQILRLEDELRESLMILRAAKTRLKSTKCLVSKYERQVGRQLDQLAGLVGELVSAGDLDPAERAAVSRTAAASVKWRRATLTTIT